MKNNIFGSFLVDIVNRCLELIFKIINIILAFLSNNRPWCNVLLCLKLIIQRPPVIYSPNPQVVPGQLWGCDRFCFSFETSSRRISIYLLIVRTRMEAFWSNTHDHVLNFFIFINELYKDIVLLFIICHHALISCPFSSAKALSYYIIGISYFFYCSGCSNCGSTLISFPWSSCFKKLSI